MYRTFCVGATIAILSATGCGGALSYTLEIPQAAIQQGVEGSFPMSTEGDEDIPIEITLSDPLVILNDQFGLETNIIVQLAEVTVPEPNLPPLPGPGPMGRTPTRPKKPDALAAKTVTGKAMISGDLSYDAAQGAFYFKNPQVKTLHFEDLPQKFEEPARGGAEQLLSKYLASNSIYTLSSDELGSHAAKSVLKSVTVQDGRLHVEIGL